MSGTRSARPRPVWSVRWAVTGAMAALTVAAVISVGAVSERSARRALAAEMEERLALQARNLAMVASGALLTDLPEWTLLPLIKEMRSRQPELAFVDIVDREGIVRADADARNLGARFSPPAELVPEAGAPALPENESLLGNRALLVASSRIVDPRGRTLGTAWVGLRRSAIAERLQAARRSQALMLAFFLVLGVLGALVLSSVLLRPIAALREGLERIGRGDLNTPLAIKGRSEIGALAETVNRMSDELRTAQSEMVERERIAHEVQLAQRIQRSLLPPGQRVVGPFVIEGEQCPAAEVGGDYFQMMDLPRGRLGLVVADVSGKGLGGSLVTAMLHALLRATAATHDSPAALLATLDRQLGEMLERGSFVTMFYGILDPASGSLTFASAGHNPLLVLRRRSGVAEWVAAKGPPLAALRSAHARAKYVDVNVRAEPGDVWIQYTDGISEAFRPADEASFGMERLAETALAARAGGCRVTLDALMAAVAAWRAGTPPHDDDTLLVISRELEPVPLTSHGEAEGNGDHAGAEALAWLREAEYSGDRLTLPATLPALRRIDDWLLEVPPLAALREPESGLLRLALHEACANVAEHACGQDPEQRFDLWWVPGAGAASDAAPGGPAVTGYFLLRDRGRAFRFEDWTPPRLSDPIVRKRGRGLGLEILRRVMSDVSYRSVATEGNFTRLAFAAARLSQERRHGYGD
jgi:serine phosphatase RsbU (regulator of sigma subunit)/anti-sigma regulatory factor (Ser/Thr protein kinase)